MFTSVSLLVLACAITINAQVPPGACNPVQIGMVPTNHPVKLQTVTLVSGIPEWLITIPPVPECAYGVAGVHAWVCDADVAPSGQFTDFNHLTVHRNGHSQGVGTVSVTVYCN